MEERNFEKASNWLLEALLAAYIKVYNEEHRLHDEFFNALDEKLRRNEIY